MKKVLFSLFLLLSAFSLQAQEPILAAVSKEVAGKEATVTGVPQQGAYVPNFKCDGSSGKVRNVILLIGDGMGLGAVASAYFANGEQLTMTSLRSMGYACTQSLSSFTTDSAASGTAYATGSKTANRRLGTDKDAKPLQNIPEAIAPKGKVSGVVSTDDVHGATPAAFFAHQDNRKNVAEIWGDIPACCLSFISAGSRKLFEKQASETRSAIEQRFKVIYDPAQPVAGVDRLIYLPPTVKTGERGKYLPETTQMAIDFLSAKKSKGFFLMVEGARIDKVAHANKLDELVNEMLDFDKAVEVAVRFAEKDGHTLVIVTADHETGGVTLKSGSSHEPGSVAAVFAGRGHTPIFVPLFAYGPHSRDFACMQQNSDVAQKILGLLK